jgi:putative phosphoribosyl transferase
MAFAGFNNRAEAGQALAKRLVERLGPIDPEKTVILALPRGGVPVATEIARATGAPLDLLLVRKIGAPGHEELAVGAIVDGDDPQVVVNDMVARQYGLNADQVREMGADGLKEIERRRKVYLEGRAPLPLTGKTAIVVDDGIATGATVKAGLKALALRKPKRVIMAMPVAPADTLSELEADTDDIVCLETPYPFFAVGAHYRDFPQVDDAAVVSAMHAAKPAPKSTNERK